MKKVWFYVPEWYLHKKTSDLPFQKYLQSDKLSEANINAQLKIPKEY